MLVGKSLDAQKMAVCHGIGLLPMFPASGIAGVSFAPQISRLGVSYSERCMRLKGETEG